MLWLERADSLGIQLLDTGFLIPAHEQRTAQRIRIQNRVSSITSAKIRLSIVSFIGKVRDVWLAR
jgi:hypothetical protein